MSWIIRTVAALSIAGLFAGLSLAQVQTVALEPAKDNTIYASSSGSLSNGAGTGLFAGAALSGLTRRGLLAFDVAGAIPAGSSIVSATLQMHLSMTQSGGVDVGLHRVLADWGEGASVADVPTGVGGGGGTQALPGDATYLHRFFPNVFWATPNGDFESTPTASATVGGTGFYTWVTNAALEVEVQGWLDAPTTNFGWLVKTAEIAGDAKRFDTREHAVPAQRPQLIILYVLPPATVGSTGTGCVGTSGTPLTLAAGGLPTLGNAGFALQLLGGPPGNAGYIFVAQGLAATPAPLGAGCLLYIDPASADMFVAAGLSPLGPVFFGPSGTGAVAVPVPGLPALAGFVVDIQGFTYDPPAPLGFLTSNALTLTIGS
jgi:hypothetical protein